MSEAACCSGLFDLLSRIVTMQISRIRGGIGAPLRYSQNWPG
jgi:hypothetical protein